MLLLFMLHLYIRSFLPSPPPIPLSLRAMGRYLKQIYSLSLSPMDCPLEHFVAAVVSRVPLPFPGGRTFHLVLDAALIAESSKCMQPISLSLPPRAFLPVMDLDFTAPFRCLSLDNIFAVFCLLLRESKLIFLCSSSTLVTDVMETFRCLLFPLVWSGGFITRLPWTLAGMLQSPGGFMIGLNITARSLSSDELPGNLLSIEREWTAHLQSGTHIVDLSGNKLYVVEGGKVEPMGSSRVSALIKMLPPSPLKKVQSIALSLCEKYDLSAKGDNLSEFDSILEPIKTTHESATEAYSPEFPTLALRDAFLVFLCDIIGDISKYIRLPVEGSEYNISGSTFSELFMKEVNGFKICFVKADI
jgi:hypothetical protein